MTFENISKDLLVEKLGLEMIGYYVCEKKLAEDVLGGIRKLKFSNSLFSELGFGVYFWSDLKTAREYKLHLEAWGKLREGKFNDQLVVKMMWKNGKGLWANNSFGKKCRDMAAQGRFRTEMSCEEGYEVISAEISLGCYCEFKDVEKVKKMLLRDPVIRRCLERILIEKGIALPESGLRMQKYRALVFEALHKTREVRNELMFDGVYTVSNQGLFWSQAPQLCLRNLDCIKKFSVESACKDEI